MTRLVRNRANWLISCAVAGSLVGRAAAAIAGARTILANGCRK